MRIRRADQCFALVVIFTRYFTKASKIFSPWAVYYLELVREGFSLVCNCQITGGKQWIGENPRAHMPKMSSLLERMCSSGQQNLAALENSPPAKRPPKNRPTCLMNCPNLKTIVLHLVNDLRTVIGMTMSVFMQMMIWIVIHQ